MVTIFDRYFNIKNRERFEDCTKEKLEKLSFMLKASGVDHAFCFTTEEEIKQINDNGAEYCVTLMYEEEKEVTCELVYMLWMKLYRNASDEDIKKAMGRKGIKGE